VRVIGPTEIGPPIGLAGIGLFVGIDSPVDTAVSVSLFIEVLVARTRFCFCTSAFLARRN